MFNEIYLTFSDILANLKDLNSTIIIVSFVLALLLVFLFIFFIIPTILIKAKKSRENKDKKEKKKLLDKILVNKSIEQEIEDDIKKLELNK